MKYIQALGAAFQREADSSIFSPDLVQEFAQARSDLATDGFTLAIEPISVSEKIIDLPDGRKVARYYGTFVHAFKTREGQYVLAPTPSEKPVSRDEASDVGVIVFLIDVNGMVIGWSDEMTGNIYGVKPPKTGSGERSTIALALPWIILCAFLLGGAWYLLGMKG